MDDGDADGMWSDRLCVVVSGMRKERALLRYLRSAALLLLTLILGVCCSVGCAPDRPKPVLLVYGDSLTVLSEPAAHLLLGGRYTLVFRAAGGSALCDWVPESRSDLAVYHPSRVVIALTGNHFTDCVRPDFQAGGEPGLVANYRTALLSMRRTFASIPMSVLAAPASRPTAAGQPAIPNGDPALNAMYRTVCAQYGMHYDTGADDTLTPGHVFVWQRPAFPGTGAMVTIRRPDGIHPTPAGSLYYAAALAG